VVLQMMDLISTLVFLHHGVQEANPLVRFMMGATAGPLAGLLAMKVAATALACFCYQTQRLNLLRKATVGYAGLIVWNLIAILVS
jgi:hypothetical protein